MLAEPTRYQVPKPYIHPQYLIGTPEGIGPCKHTTKRVRLHHMPLAYCCSMHFKHQLAAIFERVERSSPVASRCAPSEDIAILTVRRFDDTILCNAQQQIRDLQSQQMVATRIPTKRNILQLPYQFNFPAIQWLQTIACINDVSGSLQPLSTVARSRRAIQILQRANERTCATESTQPGRGNQLEREAHSTRGQCFSSPTTSAEPQCLQPSSQQPAAYMWAYNVREPCPAHPHHVAHSLWPGRPASDE